MSATKLKTRPTSGSRHCTIKRLAGSYRKRLKRHSIKRGYIKKGRNLREKLRKKRRARKRVSKPKSGQSKGSLIFLRLMLRTLKRRISVWVSKAS